MGLVHAMRSNGPLPQVFWFKQLSSNSAKPPQLALCGFALSLELSNSLRFSPNNTMSRVGTEL